MPSPSGTRSTAEDRPYGVRARRRAVLGLLVLATLTWLGVAGAAPASAHATLQSTTPYDGQVVATSPASVGLTFDEPVEVALGGVKVYAADGSRVDLGQVRHPGGAGKQVSADLRSGLAHGTYLVNWRVVSSDSHPISGSFTFSVGAAGSVAANHTPTQGSSAVRVVLAVGRFLGFAGLLVALGSVSFLLVSWPAGWPTQRAGRALTTSLAMCLAGTAVLLGFQGVEDAGLAASSFADPQVLQAFAGTRLGHYASLRVILVLAALVVVRLGVTARPPQRRAQAALGVLLLATTVTFAMSGHAAAGGTPAWQVPLDLAHLLAAGAWLGGLPLLLSLLVRPVDLTEVQRAVKRFSRLALLCVLVVCATGVVQAWRQAESLAALGATRYGDLLLTKVGLVGTILLAAGLSRQWVVEKLPVLGGQRSGELVVPMPVGTAVGTAVGAAAAGPHKAAPKSSRTASPGGRDHAALTTALRPLRQSVAVELGLGVGVVAVTAMLVASPPARVDYRPTVDRVIAVGPVEVEISAVPTGPRTMSLHIYSFTGDGTPQDVPELKVEARLTAKDIGPLQAVVVPIGSGHYTADDLHLPMAGTWTLQVYLRTTDVDSYTGTTDLEVR